MPFYGHVCPYKVTCAFTCMCSRVPLYGHMVISAPMCSCVPLYGHMVISAPMCSCVPLYGHMVISAPMCSCVPLYGLHRYTSKYQINAYVKERLLNSALVSHGYQHSSFLYNTMKLLVCSQMPLLPLTSSL